jgi:hypothetical protein
MGLIHSSYQGTRKVKHGRAKESQSNSPQTHESSSNMNNIDTQAHSYQSSSPQKSSTTPSSATDSYTVEIPQWLPISEDQVYDYALFGISMQFANVHHHQPSTEASVNQETWSCPYHSPVLESQNPSQHLTPHESDTMRRYLNGNPSEQYALFYRPDIGKLSTEKGCICVHLKHG